MLGEYELTRCAVSEARRHGVKHAFEICVHAADSSSTRGSKRDLAPRKLTVVCESHADMLNWLLQFSLVMGDGSDAPIKAPSRTSHSRAASQSALIADTHRNEASTHNGNDDNNHHNNNSNNNDEKKRPLAATSTSPRAPAVSKDDSVRRVFSAPHDRSASADPSSTTSSKLRDDNDVDAATDVDDSEPSDVRAAKLQKVRGPLWFKLYVSRQIVARHI
jgi:hypothetical protein